MRIISNFSDYYDIGLRYGIDTNIIFNRKPKEFEIMESIKYDKMNPIQIDKNKINNFLVSISEYSEFRLSPFYIGFCGKLYTGLCNYLREYVIYNAADYFKLLESKKKQESKYYNRSYKSYYDHINITNDTIELFFKEYGIRDIGHDLFSEFNTPIFVIIEQYQKNLFITNPILKEYKFVKMIDPYTAFQEISMYISGILGIANVNPDTISDISQLYKKGFDKYSFKKMKADQKK